jgi:hypothetical protein
MKKLTLLIIASSLVFFTIAQTATSDKLIKHNGEIIEAKVTKVDEGAITYKLPNEDAERVIGRIAVKKIDYANRKTENISDEVVINGKHDWSKVLIVHNEMELTGLKGRRNLWENSLLEREQFFKKKYRRKIYPKPEESCRRGLQCSILFCLHKTILT